MRRFCTALSQFAASRTGVSAIEFALLSPLLIALFFAGVSVGKAVEISRKLTITTRALADLTTQYQALSSSTLSTIFNASNQIIAPFDPTPLGMRLTEIQLDVTGLIATVTCSAASGTGFSAYKAGTLFTSLPTTIPRIPNASYILAETSYTYSPPVGTSIIAPISLGDQIYMLPRASTSVTFPGPC
jgi:Flp pilus assembly protein TadG